MTELSVTQEAPRAGGAQGAEVAKTVEQFARRARLFLQLANFSFNLTYGALIPLLPSLNERTAGVSFAAFSFFKLLLLIPAGLLVDRLRGPRALLVSVLLESIGLFCLDAFPTVPWLGRIVGGGAFSIGTIACLVLLRNLEATASRFRSALDLLFALGGLGFIFGPLLGFAIRSWSPSRGILLLAAGEFALAMVGWFLFRGSSSSEAACEKGSGGARAGDSDAACELKEQSLGYLWAPVLGLGASKALALGLEPCLGWWPTEIFRISPFLAGLGFLFCGIFYALGSFKSRRPALFLVIAAPFFIEGVLRGFLPAQPAWWIFLALMGLWFGSAVTQSIALLGWTDAAQKGRYHAVWMFFTDSPAILTTILFWQYRFQASSGRGVILLLLTVAGGLAFLSYPRGSPAETSQNP